MRLFRPQPSACQDCFFRERPCYFSPFFGLRYVYCFSSLSLLFFSLSICPYFFSFLSTLFKESILFGFRFVWDGV